MVKQKIFQHKVALGYIHKIRSWGGTFSKDFNDNLFQKILGIYWE
jgi:hypothetical protein